MVEIADLAMENQYLQEFLSYSLVNIYLIENYVII